MSGDGKPPTRAPGVAGLVALLGVGVGLAVARPMWTPRLPDGTLIEVAGDVPNPGTYLVTPATVGAAIVAAGGPPGDDPRAVPEGARVVVTADGATIEAPSEPLLPAPAPAAPAPAPVGPVDLNHATAAELERLPGIGPALAARIVADREANGPFRSVDDLDRVRGIGPATVERLRPFVVAP